jgi:hypothetical protein
MDTKAPKIARIRGRQTTACRPKSTTYSGDLLNAGLVWPLRYTPDFGRLSGRRLGLVVFPFVHSQRR